ncbi:MAG: response regulator transcription factor [Planctomycetota bacterium]
MARLKNKPNKHRPRCVVIDDHEAIGHGFARAWRAKINVVGWASTAPAGVAAVVRQKPVVATMDVGLPGDPWQAISTIVEETGGNTRVLVITGSHNPLLADQAINAGASGIESKGIPSGDTMEALLRVVAGREHWGAIWEDRVRHVRESGVLDPTTRLDAQDEKLLWAISQGMSYEAMAVAADRTPAAIYLRAQSLRKKLGAATDAEALAAAVRSGFVSPEQLRS